MKKKTAHVKRAKLPWMPNGSQGSKNNICLQLGKIDLTSLGIFGFLRGHVAGVAGWLLLALNFGKDRHVFGVILV